MPLDVSHEVNLSVTHLDGLRLADGTNNAPDVLILPSRLKQFTKVGLFHSSDVNTELTNQGRSNYNGDKSFLFVQGDIRQVGRCSQRARFLQGTAKG